MVSIYGGLKQEMLLSNAEMFRCLRVATHIETLSTIYFEGTEAQCIGHYKLIFSLLRMTKAIKLQKFALEVRKVKWVT